MLSVIMLNNNPILRRLILILGFYLLSACAFNSSSSSNQARLKKNPVPRVPPKQLPGGNGDNWRYLGTDQQLAVEINESSISTSNGTSRFQDRKTVIEPSKFDYQGLSVNYKYSLSWWQLNCSQKQYSIDSTSLYDLNGKLIQTYSVNSATSSWINIASGSMAELQYAYLCMGSNRSLGY